MSAMKRESTAILFFPLNKITSYYNKLCFLSSTVFVWYVLYLKCKVVCNGRHAQVARCRMPSHFYKTNKVHQMHLFCNRIRKETLTLFITSNSAPLDIMNVDTYWANWLYTKGNIFWWCWFGLYNIFIWFTYTVLFLHHKSNKI